MSESTPPVAALAAGRQKRKTGVWAAIAAAAAGAAAGFGGHVVNHAQAQAPDQLIIDVAVIKAELAYVRKDLDEIKSDLKRLRSNAR